MKFNTPPYIIQFQFDTSYHIYVVRRNFNLNLNINISFIWSIYPHTKKKRVRVVDHFLGKYTHFERRAQVYSDCLIVNLETQIVLEYYLSCVQNF